MLMLTHGMRIGDQQNIRTKMRDKTVTDFPFLARKKRSSRKFVSVLFILYSFEPWEEKELHLQRMMFLTLKLYISRMLKVACYENGEHFYARL